MLRDESIALAYKYKKQNQQSRNSWVRHELYTDMVHVFQAVHSLPSSKLAFKHMHTFINDVFRSKSADAVRPMILTDEERLLLRMIDSHHIVT